jgi:hypothetical protein
VCFLFVTMHRAPSEKVIVPQNKSFILLEGEGWQQTSIEWADHAGGDSTTAASPTFAAYSDDFMARDITFKVRRRPDDLFGLRAAPAAYELR